MDKDEYDRQSMAIIEELPEEFTKGDRGPGSWLSFSPIMTDHILSVFERFLTLTKEFVLAHATDEEEAANWMVNSEPVQRLVPATVMLPLIHEVQMRRAAMALADGIEVSL